MDWLIPFLFVMFIIIMPLLTGNKKKREAAEKRAQQARQNSSNPQHMGQGGYKNKPQPKAGHPYAESAKDKGMTLDDFRRKYEAMGSGRQDAPAAKPATAKPQPAKQPRRNPDRFNTEKPQNSRPVQNRAEQQAKQNSAANPPQKKSVPVTGVDISSQPGESPLMAGVMANKNELHTEFGADAVAFVKSKKLSPMQQGLLWAEILGAPKAKQPRGRY